MIKKIFIIISAISLIFLFLAGSFFYWGIYIPKDGVGEEGLFAVKTGEGLSSVAGRLENENFIKSGCFFIFYGVVAEKGKQLKPGNYRISPAMSVPEIMDIIVSGGEDRLIIIEGWNLRDIADFLEREGYATREEFFSLVGSPPFYKGGELTDHFPQEIESGVGALSQMPRDLPAEGFLFPDTYFISPGTPIEEIVLAFLYNFDRKINNDIKKKIDESEFSLFEIITIASLIEKEVISFDDKRTVSGIIQKRLQKEMRLQIDATIVYLTGRRSVKIPIKETRIDSPYNTYLYEGLPAGPICNPGMESIEAALLPKETDYLYYLSKPTGETVFSRDFNEHIEAKNKYLRQ